MDEKAAMEIANSTAVNTSNADSDQICRVGGAPAGSTTSPLAYFARVAGGATTGGDTHATPAASRTEGTDRRAKGQKASLRIRVGAPRGDAIAAGVDPHKPHDHVRADHDEHAC